MDNFLGKKLDGRYLIEELVGTGGMANVYKAQDLKYNRIVAVKILREEYLNNEDLVRRFKNESKAIAVLDHPNIVKAFDISVTDKLQFIVMEYIDGITLHEYIERRGHNLTYKETLFFVSQTLEALSHAHEKGVVHRDIKPQNIMLIEDGTIRVMDFGIARFSRAQNSATVTDKAIGSVHYISPEQAKGDVTDAKADIYSVGVMMYEMLCGKLPFESDSMVSVAIKQISDTATPLREINPNVPQALENITKRAMAKDPMQRYNSAKDMIGDIEQFKKNPSVKFEYDYLSNSTPERYIDKIVNKQKTTNQTAQGAAKPVKKKHHYGLPILAGMAVASAIGASILVYMIFKLSGNPLFNDKLDVDLPSFVDQNIQTVKTNKEYSNTFKFIVEENFNDKEAGTIYDQFPKSGKKIKEGSKVTLRVSKGIEMVVVPDLIGESKESVQKKLKDLNFYLSYRTETTSEIAPGKITKIEPAPGTSVKAGSTIYIYVSQTKQETEAKVPDLVNSTIDAAKSLLSKARLNIGTITKVESDLPEGTIIEQSPAVNTVLKRGTSVNVTVASPWEKRVRNVSVNFTDTINSTTWAATLGGGSQTQHYTTTDGVAANWIIPFEYAGGAEQTITITSSTGASATVTLNFTADGTDKAVDIGGSYVKPITKTVTVNFDTTINAGTWTATLNGAAVSTHTTADGVAGTWTFNVSGKDTLTLTITGNSTQTINIDFASAAQPGAINIGGNYKPTPPPSSSISTTTSP